MIIFTFPRILKMGTDALLHAADLCVLVNKCFAEPRMLTDS